MSQMNACMTVIQTVLDFGITVNVMLYLAISLMLQPAWETMTSTLVNVLFTSFLL